MTSSVVLSVADNAKPAAGAALHEVVLASLLGLALTAALLGLVWAHRTQRTTALGRAGERLGSRAGVPGWVALPTALTTVSLLTALFGMLWDISFHIDKGRDPGPLANPAHYFILFGLFGVFAGGVLACAMPLGIRPGPASVRFVRGWHVPVGGILLTAAGFYALIGFPLDDVWHRLFGQDVTLWGPTHLMLIGGAGLSIVGLLVLDQEGSGAEPARGAAVFARRGAAMGGLLLGLSVFQGEFDFGVPQFRLVEQPLLIAAAAGVALVAARLWIGRGGALGATAFFLVVRSVISLLVGPVLGHSTPHFPLYLGSAVLVELAAIPLAARRPVVFGAVAGALVGTLGTATEWGWTHLVQTLAWDSDILVESAVVALVCGVAGGTIGALLALGLQQRLPVRRVSLTAMTAAVLAIAACVGNGLVATVPSGVRATFHVTDASTSPRTVDVAVRLDPATAVDDPAWIQITSWQGGGLVVDPLRRTGPGQYVTTRPVPVHDDWKTLLRVHDGRQLWAVPLYLPADSAIGAKEVAATDGVTRAAQPETSILQREKKHGVPGWLWGAANVVVLLCSLAIVATMSWGVARYSDRGARSGARRTDVRPSPVPAGAR
jgi:hypothetical protein